VSDFEHLRDSFLEELYEDRAKRVYVCSRSLEMFIRVYLPHWMHHEFAPFQFEMIRDAQRLFLSPEDPNYLRFLLWRMFRESTKSSLGRALNLQMICAKDILNVRENIYWIGYEDKAVERHVRTVAEELQGNERIIADFGHLYFGEQKKYESKKKKTVMDFRTENGVHVGALGCGGSARGILDGPMRPDFCFIDDVENERTKKSPVRTAGIINFLDELMSGTAASVGYLIMGNWISEIAVMASMVKKVEAAKERGKVHTVWIEDKEGNIAWPQAWVRTKAESKKINAERKPISWVRSIEELKEDPEKLPSVMQEYYGVPKGSGGKFTAEGLRGFVMTDIEDKKREMRVCIACDQAFSTSKEADYRATGAIGILPRRVDVGEGQTVSIDDYYILDGKADLFSPTRTIEDIINLAFKWMAKGFRVTFVSAEDTKRNQKQKDFIRDLRNEMKRRGLFVPFRLSQIIGQGEKEERIITRLEPLTESGRLYVREDDPQNYFWQMLKEQFLGFPLYPKKDIIDMVAQGVHELGQAGSGGM
jgi:phage terminase large subunit-like protein